MNTGMSLSVISYEYRYVTISYIIWIQVWNCKSVDLLLMPVFAESNLMYLKVIC